MRFNRTFIYILGIVWFGLFSSFCSGADKKFNHNFKGWDSNHGRRAIISFNLLADGLVNGKLDITPLCEKKIKLAGGQLTFSGMVTGAYPQVSGSFKGLSLLCGGKKIPLNGTMKLGYHPVYGVFIQLFGNGTSEEYHFKKAKNPF